MAKKRLSNSQISNKTFSESWYSPINTDSSIPRYVKSSSGNGKWNDSYTQYILNKLHREYDTRDRDTAPSNTGV